MHRFGKPERIITDRETSFTFTTFEYVFVPSGWCCWATEQNVRLILQRLVDSSESRT